MEFIDNVIVNVKENLLSELIISILSSGVPMFYIFRNLNDIKELEVFVNASLTGEDLFNYIFSFAIAFVFIALIRYFFRNRVIKSLYYIIKSMSSGIINVYRLAAGILLSFPLVWYLGEPSSLTISRTTYFMVFGFGCVFVSSVFLAIHNCTEKLFDKRI
jgi:hypothetical protein